MKPFLKSHKSLNPNSADLTTEDTESTESELFTIRQREDAARLEGKHEPQSSIWAGARTEGLGKPKEEQLKVGPWGAQHRGRCKSKSNRRVSRFGARESKYKERTERKKCKRWLWLSNLWFSVFSVFHSPRRSQTAATDTGHQLPAPRNGFSTILQSFHFGSAPLTTRMHPCP